jgi:hypothetical protein
MTVDWNNHSAREQTSCDYLSLSMDMHAYTHTAYIYIYIHIHVIPTVEYHTTVK